MSNDETPESVGMLALVVHEMTALLAIVTAATSTMRDTKNEGLVLLADTIDRKVRDECPFCKTILDDHAKQRASAN